MTDRRAFLKLLAASPLLAGVPYIGQALAQTPTLQGIDSLVANAPDALDVFDLEAVARRNIPPAHWGYLAAGVDGEETLRANQQAFSRYQLHTKRFVDLSKMGMSLDLFGTTYKSPIFLSPLGAQRAFHPEGEIGSAKAAASRGHLQVLSTVSSIGVEDVAAAYDAPIWYQLYTTNKWDITVKLVKRAEAAGCPVVAVTVDLPVGRNTESATRWARTDTRTCSSCHAAGGPDPRTRPMFSGNDMTGVGLNSSSLTWDFIKRLKDVTKMKVLIKGLESRGDAELAVRHGADGIIVSNHGGRATETGRSTLEALPEVVAAVRGRVPVLVDGGVRRGTDVLKALALGATAVGIGRPYVWGLGAFGQAGVERVLDILNNELRLAMAGVGARTLRDITAASLIRKA
jgi:4-hydroxymandelate oxidase